MKKAKRLILLLGILSVLLCVSALAAEPTTAGIYGVSSETGITIVPLDAGGNEITKTSATIDSAAVTDFYAGAVKLRVTYSSAVDDSYYLVLALNTETSTPTADDIIYIDQKSAASGVTFDVYPSEMGKGEYYIYLASNASSGISELTQVASFKSFVPYILGDANDDKVVNVNDAVKILKCIVGNDSFTGNEELAADANEDEVVNVNDAVTILKYIVGNGTLGK